MALKLVISLLLIGILVTKNECFNVDRKDKESKLKDDCPVPYSQCNLGKPGMINVHIVPHTHDDVG